MNCSNMFVRLGLARLDAVVYQRPFILLLYTNSDLILHPIELILGLFESLGHPTVPDVAVFRYRTLMSRVGQSKKIV